VTQYLRGWNEKDPQALSLVVGSVYAELHRIAARMLASERSDHTLQPSALINELYLRLHASKPPEWRSRAHFFAVAASTLRRILIDHARAHRAEQRGGGQSPVPLDMVEAGAPCSYDDLLMVDAALEELEQEDPRAARVTELRFFGGCLKARSPRNWGSRKLPSSATGSLRAPGWRGDWGRATGVSGNTVHLEESGRNFSDRRRLSAGRAGNFDWLPTNRQLEVNTTRYGTNRRLFLEGRPNLSNRGHDSGRTFIRNHVAAVANYNLFSSR